MEEFVDWNTAVLVELNANVLEAKAVGIGFKANSNKNGVTRDLVLL